MNKIFEIIIVIILVTAVVGVSWGAINQSLNNPNSGTIPSAMLVTVEFDDIVKVDGDPFLWGSLGYGDNLKTMNVTNISDGVIRVFLYYDNVPANWLVTWNMNNTLIDVGASAVDNYNITVPQGYTSGSYNWNTRIYVEQT